MNMRAGVRRMVCSTPATDLSSWRPLLVLTCLIAGLSSGCRAPALVFTTVTVIGAEATADEGLEHHFLVGYKRFEGALVPLLPESSSITGEGAYSVFATLDFKAGMFRTKIAQVFATGSAAIAMAGSPDAVSNMTSATKGVTASYNLDAGAELLRAKIEQRLDDPTDDPDNPGSPIGGANYFALREHLDNKGTVVSITPWLYTAPARELETAIQALGWE